LYLFLPTLLVDLNGGIFLPLKLEILCDFKKKVVFCALITAMQKDMKNHTTLHSTVLEEKQMSHLIHLISGIIPHPHQLSCHSGPRPTGAGSNQGSKKNPL